MLRICFLLFFLRRSTVKSTTSWPTSSFTTPTPTNFTTTNTTAVEEILSPLQLEATPNYPVAAGQKVHLHCSASIVPVSVRWYWQRLVNQTWQNVSSDRDLTLSEPWQSGPYRCHAESLLSREESADHTVYIVSMHKTAAENLGFVALFFSLLALTINLAIIFWLGWQRHNATLTGAAAKGFPEPQKSPKGGLPQTECDGDVYMNYANNSQAYTDLDPTKKTDDNVYSSLS